MNNLFKMLWNKYLKGGVLGFGLSCNTNTKKSFHYFFRSKVGSTSIEFIISFSFFLVILLFFMEVCRFLALSSTIDLSLAEAARLTSRNKLTSSSYLELLNQNIRNKTFTWLFFKDASMSDLKLSITYCDTIQDITNDSCGLDPTKKIAIYNVTYKYSTLFLPMPSKYFNGVIINGQIVYVQEHVATK